MLLVEGDVSVACADFVNLVICRLNRLEHLQCVSKPNHRGMMVRFIHWSIRTIHNLSLVRILQMVRTDSNRKIERQAESMHGGLMPVAELTILNFLI